MRLRRQARSWLLVPAVLVVAAAVLVACGGTAQGNVLSPGASVSASASAGPGGVSGGVSSDKVLIAGSAFVPPDITVKVGTTVTWTNKDPMPHDVTSTDGPGTGAATTNLFSSGTLNQGQTFSYTFTKAGTYYYECTIHASQPAMHGTVVVQ